MEGLLGQKIHEIIPRGIDEEITKIGKIENFLRIKKKEKRVMEKLNGKTQEGINNNRYN